MEIPGAMDLDGEVHFGTLGRSIPDPRHLILPDPTRSFGFGAKLFAPRLFILDAQVSQKLPQLLLAAIMFNLSP